VAVRAAVPPGRAGRLWLRDRIEVATRGRDQLDRKLRLLLPEAARLRAAAEQQRAEWRTAYQDGQLWRLRAGLVGGQDALRRSLPAAPARMSSALLTVMGVSYPSDVAVQAPPEAVLPPDTVAAEQAAESFRRAVTAGARTAAADESVRRVEEEIAATRRRYRALDRRWLPYLTAALAALDIALAQEEQDDSARRRAATGRDATARA